MTTGPASVEPYRAFVAGILEAADLIAAKDHRTDTRDDDLHDRGWDRALKEAEHDLRQHAALMLDDAEGIER